MGNEESHGKRKKRPEDALFDAAFEMKSQAKQLEREAQKVQQKEAIERKKIVAVLISFSFYIGFHIGTLKRKC